MASQNIKKGIKEQTHLVQSNLWNSFKSSYGTKVENYKNVYFLVKKIPFSSFYMGYAPKVNFNNIKIDFNDFKKFLISKKIVFVRFDVPNVLQEEGGASEKTLQKNCKKAPRNTFTKKNIYMDLTPNIEQISSNFHQKKRYNIKQALKKGVEIKIVQDAKGFENFWKLHQLTAKNQGFLIHSKEYFNTVYKAFDNNVFFVQAFVDNKIASVWMIIKDNFTIYYIYGGSDPKYNNYFPNDLVGFESIKLGEHLGATLFDMWGAEGGKGFTDFKLKYGGELVEYIDSYDFIINNFWYSWFNFIYESFWKLVNLKKKIGI